FPEELLAELRIARERIADHLERHEPAELGLHREVDPGHPAAADLALDLESGNLHQDPWGSSTWISPSTRRPSTNRPSTTMRSPSMLAAEPLPWARPLMHDGASNIHGLPSMVSVQRGTSCSGRDDIRLPCCQRCSSLRPSGACFTP